MRRTFVLRLVLLNTFKKRLRSLLVIGGIAVTSSVMIVLFGISGGLHALVSDQVAHSEAKDVVTVDQRNLQQIKLNEEKVSQITSMSGVGDVESSVGLLGDVIYHGTDLSIPVYGVSKGYFSVSPAAVRAGHTEQLQGTNIIVSTKVLEAFGINPDEAINKPVLSSITVSKDYSSNLKEEAFTTKQETFTIVGVVDKGDLPIAYVPMEGLRTQGVDSVSQLKVRVSVSEKIPAVRESIEQMGFQTASIQDTVEQINKVFTVIQRAMVLFALVVFGITVSGTFTLISLTLMEEMKQIGYLRVSGMKNRDVRILFILQSMLLTTMGAVSGIFGGLLGGGVVNELARAAASDEVFTGNVTVFAVPTSQIVMVLALSLVIGWIVGIFPAKRAVMAKPLAEMKL